MGAKRSWRNRHRALHGSAKCQRRAEEYVARELKRMQRNGCAGFRVHPEFGWCQRVLLEKYGLAVDFDADRLSKKCRPLRTMRDDNFPPGSWHCRKRIGLVYVADGTEEILVGPRGATSFFYSTAVLQYFLCQRRKHAI